MIQSFESWHSQCPASLRSKEGLINKKYSSKASNSILICCSSTNNSSKKSKVTKPSKGMDGKLLPLAAFKPIYFCVQLWVIASRIIQKFQQIIWPHLLWLQCLLEGTVSQDSPTPETVPIKQPSKLANFTAPRSDVFWTYFHFLQQPIKTQPHSHFPRL